MKGIFSIALILASVGNIHAQGRGDDSNEIVVMGNKFDMSGSVMDTMLIVDPIDGSETIRVYVDDVPVSMNGKKIYKLNEVTTPPQTKMGSVLLEDYIIEAAKKNLIKWNVEGATRIELGRFVIDEQGKIVYYHYHGTTCRPGDGVVRKLGNPFDDKLEEILAKAPPMQPAKVNGKNVLAFAPIAMRDYKITVRNKTVTYSRDSEKLSTIKRRK